MRKRIPSYLLVIVVLFAVPADTAASERTACPDESAEDFFFATGTFGLQDSFSDTFQFSDTIHREWYSEILRAMQEPSLSCGNSGRVYRFTWIPAFSYPVVVRITDNGGEIILAAVELDISGGEGNRTVKRQTLTVLSRDRMDRLQSALAKADFRSMPAVEGGIGLDGAEWIIEILEDGTEHGVTRWSPGRGPFRDIGLQFLRLAKWPFNTRGIY